MQRFESYGLLGSRRQGLLPSGTATLAEVMVSRTLDGMKDDAAAMPTRTQQEKPTRTVSAPAESRPAVALTHGVRHA
jgi:hypothetical protein